MDTLEDYAMRCGEWLQKRVRELEAADPQLVELKEEVRKTLRRVLSASDRDRPARLSENTEAIRALMQHVVHERSR
jgi:hypothetical protein